MAQSIAPMPVAFSFVIGVLTSIGMSSALFSARMPWSEQLKCLYRSTNPIQPVDGPWLRSFYTAMTCSVVLGLAVLEHSYGGNDALKVGISFAVIVPILAELKSWSLHLVDRIYWRRKAPDSPAATPLNLYVYVIGATVTMASLVAGVLVFESSLRVFLK